MPGTPDRTSCSKLLNHAASSRSAICSVPLTRYLKRSNVRFQTVIKRTRVVCSPTAQRWRSVARRALFRQGRERYFAAFAAAARTAAQRFFVASMILFRPSALSFRFGFLATGSAVLAAMPDSFLAAAHLFRCASPIRSLAAALTFRRLPTGFGVDCGAGVVRRSAIAGVLQRQRLLRALAPEPFTYCKQPGSHW